MGTTNLYKHFIKYTMNDLRPDDQATNEYLNEQTLNTSINDTFT